MIKLTDKWSLTSDRHQWILNETYKGKEKKTGKGKLQTKQSFHSNISQVVAHLVNQEAKAYDSIKEIQLAMLAATTTITNHLNLVEGLEK